MPTSNRSSVFNYLNVVAFLINLATNFAPAPNQMDELSSKYQTLITPAGYAFSVWGVIFLAEAAFCVAQCFLPAFRDSPLLVKGIGYNFILANLVQAGWVFAFTWYEIIWLSLICMVAIFVFLARIVYTQYSLSKDTAVSAADYWLLKFPVTMHFGWITVATLVNMNVLVVDLGTSAGAQYLVALACLALIPIVTMSLLFVSRNVGYVVSGVFCWATYAIFVGLGNAKDLIVTTFADQQIQVVRSSALAVCIITALAIVARLFNETLKRRQQPTSPETASLRENEYGLHT